MTEQSLAAMDEICELLKRAGEATDLDHAVRLYKLGADKCRLALKLTGLDARERDWFGKSLAECMAGSGPAIKRTAAVSR